MPNEPKKRRQRRRVKIVVVDAIVLSSWWTTKAETLSLSWRVSQQSINLVALRCLFSHSKPLKPLAPLTPLQIHLLLSLTGSHEYQQHCQGPSFILPFLLARFVLLYFEPWKAWPTHRRAKTSSGDLFEPSTWNFLMATSRVTMCDPNITIIIMTSDINSIYYHNSKYILKASTEYKK